MTVSVTSFYQELPSAQSYTSLILRQFSKWYWEPQFNLLTGGTAVAEESK
jgi:hypothetical protein